jgi:hypothetical protein
MIQSQFNEIKGERDSGYYLQRRKFKDLLRLLDRIVGVNFPDGGGYSAIHLAVEARNREKVKAVLELKPDLNMVAFDGQSVLSPPLFLFLYNGGARAPGLINDCYGAEKLLEYRKRRS